MPENGKLQSTPWENVNLKYKKTFQHCIFPQIKASVG